MKVRFVVEKGTKGHDDVEVIVGGIRSLPKYVLITAQDFTTPIGTGRAFLLNNELHVEADLREQEFSLYPTIGIETIHEDDVGGSIVVRESELHTISLQPHPNTDPGIKSIAEQLTEGSAEIISS